MRFQAAHPPMTSRFRVFAVSVLMLALALSATTQTINTLTAEEQKEGWTQLFDGKTLNGWVATGDAKWDVRNGELVAVPGTTRGQLTTANQYGDFRLRLDFWVDEGTNSGVFIRSPETGAITQGNAFEVNIFDKSAEWPTGSINEIQKSPLPPNTVGKWNTYDISAQGDHLVVLLTGQKTVDARASRRPRGLIALSYSGGTLKFRNIRILAK